jgi:cardiolipin synthase
MLMVAPLVWLLIEGNYPWVLAVFFVAGFTDGLDGFLAKRFDWRSWLGGILDPLADKLLLVSTFLTLTYIGLTPLWLLIAVVARDLLIILGGVAYRIFIGTVIARPTAISKLNSACQLLYVLLVVADAGYDIPGQTIVGVMSWVVLATTVTSGLDYVYTWGSKAWQASRRDRA